MLSRSYARKFCLALTAIAALSLFAIQAYAKPTTKDDAVAAVGGWLKQPGHGLTAAMGNAVKETQTFADATGAPAYYVVYLKPAGFIIVAADDLVEPIICFCPGGKFDPSPKNPLGALVTGDVPNRVAAVRAATQAAKLAPEMVSSQAKWANLKSVAAGVVSPLPGNPSDIRVAPLTQTTWSQDVAGDDTYIACYNYYTPNGNPPPDSYDTPGAYTNDVCGCVATCMAQIMYYWKYPTAGVGTASMPVLVYDPTNEEWYEEYVALLGGDGNGGEYDWADMVLSPSSSITPTQCQAIGALCADAGTSVIMQYSPDDSGAYLTDAATALKSVFMYSNVVAAHNDYSNQANIPLSVLTTMMNPDLDAGYPCILGITGSGGGHCIAADGYGYNSGTLYHHLNLGWSGYDTAWYNLPNIGTYYDFNVVDDCLFNIYRSGSGEVISGRVLDLSGNPLSGAQVRATGTHGNSYSGTTTSNTNGIYAFVGVPSASSLSLTATATGRVFTTVAVTTGTSKNYNASCGNVWNANIAQGQPANLTMAVSPSAGGTTFPTQGQVTVVAKGSPTLITASPATGYVLDHWGFTSGVVVADPYAVSTTATLTGAATVTAYFVQPPAGAVWAWGLNSNGQLGNQTTTERFHPTQTLDAPANPSQICAGLYHALALAGNGSVWAWGSNSSGQLGIGTLVDSHVPVQVSSLQGILWIAAGMYQSFAVDSTGAVWAWGSNSAGQLGDGTKINRETPVKVAGLTGVTIVQVAAGQCHTVALDSNGNVWAWGTNNRGQLGKNVNVLYSLLPMKVPGLPAGITSIAAGASFSLALAPSESIWAWGANESGQLGIGTHSDTYTPTLLSGISGVTNIGAGSNHSLAITSGGSVWAWGSNNYGQLGVGTSATTYTTPMQVTTSTGGTLGNGVEVAGGSCHSVVLDSSGNVWTMGSNGQGQTGDGLPTTTRLSAVEVSNLLAAAQIGAGGWSSFCIQGASSGAPGSATPLTVAATQSAPSAVQSSQETAGSAATAAPEPDAGGGASVGTGATGLSTVAVIVDYLDQSTTKKFQSLSGNWVTCTLANAANGAYAGGYSVAASSSGAVTARARFSCSSLAGGQYDVYAWWPAMADNATHVAYDIHQAAGVTTVRVDQTERGGQWNLLGTFTFVGGSHVVDVQNSNSQPGAAVCADAVKFVPAAK